MKGVFRAATSLAVGFAARSIHASSAGGVVRRLRCRDEQFFQTRKIGVLVLLLNAFQIVDHLIGGAGIVAPISARAKERGMAIDSIRARVVIVGDAIETDDCLSIGETDRRLEDIPQRVRVKIEIFTTVLLRDAHHLTEPIHLDDELGMQGHRGRAGRHQRMRGRRANGRREGGQAEDRGDKQGSERIAKFSHERGVNDS